MFMNLSSENDFVITKKKNDDFDDSDLKIYEWENL